MSGPSFFLDGPSGTDVDEATLLARQWASLVEDPAVLVDDTDYSSKQWALWSQQYALEAQAAKDTVEAFVITTPYVLAVTQHDAAPAVDDAEYFFALQAGTITQLHAGLLNPQESGDACAVEFRLNGVAIDTVTITNTEYTATVTVSQALAVDDVVSVHVTAVGTGGAGLRCGLLVQGP